jgi:hypothetical protein
MEWRCEWCGEPQSANDPPCPNCGHGTFEEVDDPTDDQQDVTTSVWVCTSCGREHPKHSPPCSRCGNMEFEHRERDLEAIEAELDVGGYLDVASPRYLVGFIIAAVAIAVLALGVAGVIDLPGAGGEVPSVADVPGNDTIVDGYELDVVEDAYVAELNARRAEGGQPRLERASALDTVARYANRRRVAEVYEDREPVAGDELAQVANPDCGDTIQWQKTDVALDRQDDGSLADVDSPTDLAAMLVDAMERRDGLPQSSNDAVGVDVHVGPDGRLFVTQMSCPT